MAYPTLTDNPGAIELAEKMRRGEMSPLDAVEAAIATTLLLDGIAAAPSNSFLTLEE